MTLHRPEDPTETARWERDKFPRRLRTQAERDADGTTWRAPGICGNTIHSLLGGDPLVCARTAGHDGGHQDKHGSLWTLPGPSGLVDIHRIVVPTPPRRRWWHRYTRRTR